jgi:hypothetical protein
LAKFSELIYGSGVTYGEPSRIAFSAEPLSSVAIGYNKVQVTWSKPANTSVASYVGFRLVRNQNAYPETEEDGAILYDFYTATNQTIDLATFIDGEDSIAKNASELVGGRYAFYRAWILLDPTGAWVRAGDTYTLVPGNHATATTNATVATVVENGEIRDTTIGVQELATTHDRFMSFIPRVFTSAKQGPLDVSQDYDPVIDASGKTDNSLLSTFLSGFSLTLDEFLTHADLILPEQTGKNTDPGILDLQSQQLGLTSDITGISKTQKQLVREALYIYRRKGTTSGLQTYVESLSGYDATIGVSKNLMLSSQDSTFNEGLGFWIANTGATMAVAQDRTPPSTEPLAIDLSYTARVNVTTSLASITNGAANPTTRGIPVVAGTEYTLSVYGSTTGTHSGVTASIKPEITWYDRKGMRIGNPIAANSATTVDSWTKVSFTATAPTHALYASIAFTFTGPCGYAIDMVQFADSSATAFEEARAVNIFLNAEKTNHVVNPSFEYNDSGSALTGWTKDVASFSRPTLGFGNSYNGPEGRVGLKKLRIVGKSSSTTFLSTQMPTANTPEQFYTFSIYGQLVSTNSSDTKTFNLQLSRGSSNVVTVPVTLTTSWQRFEVTLYSDLATFNNTALTASFIGNLNGATVEFDGAQCEMSRNASDYFDGSLVFSGAAWAGTPMNSISYIYPNLANRSLRLSQEIKGFLPLNTPYRVSWHSNAGDSFSDFS